MTSPRVRSTVTRASLTAPWGVMATLVLLAFGLSLVARGDTTLAIDRGATIAVQRLDGEPWRTLAWIGNGLGANPFSVGLALALLAGSLLRRDARDASFLSILLVLRLTATLLKGLFDSPRPTSDVAELVGTFDGLGFPSGHATSAATLLGGLGFLALRHVRWSGVVPVVTLVTAAGIALTGFARIWVGAHWLTDVIGGALYGLVIVLLAANLSALVARRFPVSRQAGRPRGVIPSANPRR